MGQVNAHLPFFQNILFDLDLAFRAIYTIILGQR